MNDPGYEEAEPGVARGAARVIAHHSRWADDFIAEAERIRSSMASIADENRAPVKEDARLRMPAIEHVGSTSVPGLAAKPLIDIMIGFRDPDEFAGWRAALFALEYEYKGEPFAAGDHIFLLTAGGILHTHKVHLSPYDGDEWRRKLALRDFLRNDSATARRYGHMKTKLARRFPGDRGQYQRHKGHFIRELLREIGDSQ